MKNQHFNRWIVSCQYQCAICHNYVNLLKGIWSRFSADLGSVIFWPSGQVWKVGELFAHCTRSWNNGICRWLSKLPLKLVAASSDDSSATAAVRSGSCSSAFRWGTRNLWRTPNPRQLVDTGHLNNGLESNRTPPGISFQWSWSKAENY